MQTILARGMRVLNQGNPVNSLIRTRPCSWGGEGGGRLLLDRDEDEMKISPSIPPKPGQSFKKNKL